MLEIQTQVQSPKGSEYIQLISYVSLTVRHKEYLTRMHSIIKSRNNLAWQDLWRSSGPTPLSKQGHAWSQFRLLSPVQTSFEYPQGWSFNKPRPWNLLQYLTMVTVKVLSNLTEVGYLQSRQFPTTLLAEILSLTSSIWCWSHSTTCSSTKIKSHLFLIFPKPLLSEINANSMHTYRIDHMAWCCKCASVSQAH